MFENPPKSGFFIAHAISEGIVMTEKNKGGRPTIYTTELALEICELIAHGKPLTKICKMEGMPSYAAVLEWLSRKDEPFSEFVGMYAKAREDQADTLADEIIEIADDSSQDTTTDQNGNPRMDSEWVQRSRLRVDARKWIAAKLKPRKYGEKVETTLKGDVENPVVTIDLTKMTLNEKLEYLARNKNG